jgi:SPP1 family predicted phage head-tail adaptor
MNPGAATHLITLLTDSGSSVDSYGAPVQSWGTLAQVWAKVRWLGSRERFANDRPVAVKAGAATIYYRSDVTELKRVQIGSEIFQVTGMRELGDKEDLELTIEKVT